ncbi:hypothetical protein EDE15_4493 [Edaphobacter aggregans]|uniref:Nickel/cobalt transporter regulator n=1 Tax=Edaphobacter aggregans TaxID=570835 RepID=A0A428MPP4_9BACT|nr:hypothetical protein [Edaphobacter aggregans]RSL18887.1 hypothetical protein EDE15_4493 [Edaphobacter aggregans]
MKVIGIASTAVLSFLLGIAPAYAQQGQQGEKQDHPEQQQSKHEQSKPEQQHAQQPQRAEQQEQNQNKQQQHVQQQQDQNRQQQHAQQQRGNEQPERTQEQQRVQQSAWQQHRAQSWQSDHRNWQQRGGYHGYRIPDDRFRGYFGPEHGFRIYGLPFLVVGGYPRFQYGGYWLSPVDPWPEYWANNWYDTDDVYIAYADNGYYLFNRRYPNVGIAISISV